MVRKQIRLEDSQLKALRQLSAASGRSMAELIRQGVDLYLSAQQRAGREERIERGLRAAGRFSSGMRDGSADHDRHLAAGFCARGLQKPR